MMKPFLIIILFFLVVIASGCKTGSKTISTHQNTKVEVREKLIRVVNPADSANIRALMECDDNGRVLLRWIDAETSKNARLQLKLDSMGQLKARFKVMHDTICIPGKDSIATEQIEVVKEVPRDFTRWQTFCLWCTPIMIGIIGLTAAAWLRKKTRLWR